MNLFNIKRALLVPYTSLMRRKYRKILATAPASYVAMVEAHYYRPTFIRWAYKLAENPELLVDAPLDASSIVIDAGAYVGDWSAQIIAKYDPKLYLFEPNPACFPALRERFMGNAKVRCFEYGLHSTNATLPLVQAALGSSIFPETIAAPGETTPVALRDVTQVFDELGCEQIDLLKLNIEGGEFEVLDRLIETRRILQVRTLLVQFHEKRDGAYLWRHRIRRALARSHHCDWDFPYVWEKWTRHA